MELEHGAGLGAFRLTGLFIIAPGYGAGVTAYSDSLGAIVTGVNMAIKFTSPSNMPSLQVRM
jgi:hypothetical protein